MAKTQKRKEVLNVCAKTLFSIQKIIFFSTISMIIYCLLILVQWKILEVDVLSINETMTGLVSLVAGFSLSHYFMRYIKTDVVEDLKEMLEIIFE